MLAALIPLSPGFNNVGQSGEIVAVQAATSNEAATVSIKAIERLTVFTNATAEVITYETAYALTYTNFDGNASIKTNVVGYVDYDYFKTNGVSKILGYPVRFDMTITNTVVTARVPAQTWTATNDLATVTTTDHFGHTVTNGYLFGGGIVVEGAEEGDIINLLIK